MTRSRLIKTTDLSGLTPVLVDGTFNGRMRKMALTAARNGYFFVVDRTTGEHLLTSKFSASANWAEPELNTKGQPVRVPEWVAAVLEQLGGEA